jgi:hypothetical protein
MKIRRLALPAVAVCLAIAAGSYTYKQREIRVAIVPAAAILHLEQDGRLPDMTYVAAREEAAKRLAGLIAAQGSVGRYRIMPQQEVHALLDDLGWTPGDMYAPRTPDRTAQSQELRGKDDIIGLADSVDSLRSGRAAWTTYRHMRPPATTPESANYGIAVLGGGAVPVPDPTRARRLAKALDVDLLIYVQLDEVAGFTDSRGRNQSGEYSLSYNPMFPFDNGSGYPYRQLARLSRYASFTERLPYRIQIVSGSDGTVIDSRDAYGDSLRAISQHGEGPAMIRPRGPDEIVGNAQADGVPRITRTLATGPMQPVFKQR